MPAETDRPIVQPTARPTTERHVASTPQPLRPASRAARLLTLTLTLTLSLAAPLLLVACQRAEEAAGPVGGAQQAKVAAQKAAAAADAAIDPAVAEVNRSMALPVPVGDSTAPVELRYGLPAAPTVGQAFHLDLAVLPQAASPVVRVEVRGGQGVTVLEPLEPVAVERVQAGTVLRVPVMAQVAASGTHVLNLTVTLELPTGAESRSFAVPVVAR